MKRKYIIRRIIVLAILIGIIAFILFMVFNKNLNNKNVLIKDNVTLELNHKYSLTDYVKVNNGQILDNVNIDTSSLGNKEIKFKVSIKNNEEEYIFKYLVKDSEAPKITFKEKLETTLGKKIDLLDNVKVEDNSKEDIKAKVEGDYNFNKEGEYTLYYVASDSSNNTSKEEFKLIVNKTNNNIEDDNKEHTKPDQEFTTSKGFKGIIKNGITYIDGVLIANKTYALPSTYGNGLDSKVEKYANEMFNAAKLESNLNIYIASGYRSYTTQKKLYNNYVNRDGKKAADTYSARAGHSEHQSGLAFDVCHNGYGCINSTFDNTPPAKWLADNAYKFGFILRYPKGKEYETGYMYESWHFRYVGEELAKKLYNNGDWITLEDYFGITSEYDY